MLSPTTTSYSIFNNGSDFVHQSINYQIFYMCEKNVLKVELFGSFNLKFIGFCEKCSCSVSYPNSPNDYCFSSVGPTRTYTQFSSGLSLFPSTGFLHKTSKGWFRSNLELASIGVISRVNTTSYRSTIDGRMVVLDEEVILKPWHSFSDGFYLNCDGVTLESGVLESNESSIVYSYGVCVGDKCSEQLTVLSSVEF